MADEVERIRTSLDEMRILVNNLEPTSGRQIVFRALSSVNESLVKYERDLLNPPMPQLPHPTPTCIVHGKPITWEDPECEICKALKEGNYDGKIGAHDNFRDAPSRRPNP